MKSFARCFSLLCTACFLFSMIASPAYATNSLENHVLTEVTALAGRTLNITVSARQYQYNG